jgi:hypothetical protein
VANALVTLVSDTDLSRTMGAAARDRVVRELSYPVLAARLQPLVAGDLATLTTA